MSSEPKYLVVIKWPDGAVTRATVTKKTLRGFSLKACRGASVSWRKLP